MQLVFDNPYSEARCNRMVRTISLESGFLPNLKDLINEALPLLKTKLSNLMIDDRDKAATQYIQEILLLETRANYKAKHLDFLTFGANFVSIPLGFKGHLIDYGSELLTTLSDGGKTLNQLLAATNIQLANCITNSDAILSMKENTKIYTDANNSRTTSNRKLGEYIVANNGVSKVPMTKVLYRLSDIAILGKQAKDLNGIIRDLKISQVKDKVTELTSMADILIKSLKGDNVKKVSPIQAKNISTALYETAAYVEFISVVYYDTVVFTQSINNLFKFVVES